MPESDFFGYSREKVGSFLLSADYASLYFANIPGGTAVAAQKAGLVQNATLAYQQQVQPRFETGSHELFWLTGQSLGTLQVSRLVGEKGILDGVSVNNNSNNLRKGLIGSVEMKLGRQGLTGLTVKQQVIALSGCVMGNIGLGWGVGGFDVQESFSVSVALMKKVALSL